MEALVETAQRAQLIGTQVATAKCVGLIQPNDALVFQRIDTWKCGLETLHAIERAILIVLRAPHRHNLRHKIIERRHAHTLLFARASAPAIDASNLALAEKHGRQPHDDKHACACDRNAQNQWQESSLVILAMLLIDITCYRRIARYVFMRAAAVGFTHIDDVIGLNSLVVKTGRHFNRSPTDTLYIDLTPGMRLIRTKQHISVVVARSIALVRTDTGIPCSRKAIVATVAK